MEPPSDPVRAQLLGSLAGADVDRGVWVLVPADAGYPGSPLDALLPVGRAGLLVEAPGPVGLLSGLPAS
ncbi:MAG: hypothetical protein JWO60_2039, partial [Frankiales bacterium]|nr:hypothetical protein [Frankiales bacterium]